MPSSDVESTGTSVSLTGYPDIDELLRQFTNSAAHDKVAAYVYGNLIKRPSLTVASQKRAIYTVKNSKSTFQYVMTDLDIAWLARSLMGEGGGRRSSASKHAWVMFNRFMLVYHSSFQSFWRMILDFSQPVNPKWRRDGRFCKVGGRYHNNDLCSPQKLARRDRMAFGPITQPQLGFAEELAVGTLEAPTKVYVNFGGTAYGKAHGEFVDKEWYLTAEQDVNSKWPSGKVLKIGIRAVEPADTVTPLTHNQLLSYVTNKIGGEQRAQQNQVVNKGGINSSASTQAQAEATQKLQQVANGAQMALAAQNMVVSLVSQAPQGDDGFQVGADDTWNRV